MDVPVHAFRSLAGDALQQADLVKIFRQFLWGTGVNTTLSDSFPGIGHRRFLRRFSPSVQSHGLQNACGMENCLPVPPVALKMHLRDMALFADCFNQCKGFLIKSTKLPELITSSLWWMPVTFQAVPGSGQNLRYCLGKNQDGSRRIGTVSKNSQAPQHDDFTGIFFH